ncbi:hypothetical protein AB6A40_005367 [Gnathostoma spinigerum]|uniref:Globin domain-containing protein n=1 Tax=Gnathostoma spinigerum TaxID=75299 RepID=A0ABD6ENU4_9BILA
MTAVHELASKADKPDDIKKFAEGIIDRHLKINIELEPSLWTKFWPIFVDFLKSKGPIDDATCKCWIDTGNQFGTACVSHLKALGKAC